MEGIALSLPTLSRVGLVQDGSVKNRNNNCAINPCVYTQPDKLKHNPFILMHNSRVIIAILLLFITPWLGTPIHAGEWKIQAAGEGGVEAPALPKFIGNVRLHSAKLIPSGLPDGREAVIESGDVQRAWYEDATERYGHGVIGDAIEAGALVVRDGDYKKITLTLPEELVFEDRYPRLVDLDQDGSMEVVTILSHANQGAAISIYKVRGGELVQVAQTPFIGTANRWRNIAGFADYLGNGKIQFMEVVTPHIGGTLNLWSYDAGKLTREKSVHGFSNHAIGSRALELSVSHDFDGDGVSDIAVPDGARRNLRLMSGKQLKEIDKIKLPAAIDGNIYLYRLAGRLNFSVSLQRRNGRFLVSKD